MLALKLLGILLTAVVAATVARIVLGPEVRMYRLPSASMAPTVPAGGKVLANFAAYDGTAPRLGDVVLVDAPADGTECRTAPARGQMCAVPPSAFTETKYVRRIVGLPGDQLSLQDGRVVRNGRPLDEPFAHPCADSCDFPRAITVPAGAYYALGDNRGASFDSRFWGPVPRKEVLARVDDCAPVIRLICRAKR
jgi:signal peptidase I